MKIQIFLLPTLICILSMVSCSETQRIPGEPTDVDENVLAEGAERMRPQTEQFLLYTLDDGNRNLISLLTRTLEFDRMSGRQALRITQRYDGANDVSFDTSWVDRGTLAPIAYSAHSSGQTQRFTFTSGHVSGITSSPEHADQQVELPLEEPVYNSVVLQEVITALPLEYGTAFRFRGYNPGRALFTFVVRVSSEDEIAIAGSESVDTWVLSMKGGALPVTLWVTKERQELLRLRTVLPNGSVFWKVRIYPVE